MLLGAVEASGQGVSAFPAQAKVGASVSFGGVVVYASPRSGIWVHDGSGGVLVRAAPGLSPEVQRRLRVGDAVRVRGTVRPCGFRPCVVASALEVSGTGALPEPARLSVDAVLAGHYYGEWVEMEAVVYEVMRRSGEWWVRLVTEDVPAAVVMPHGPPPSNGQNVRWRGVVGAEYDADGRYLGLVLHVPDSAFAVPLSRTAPESLPLLPIGTLSKPGALPESRVRVQGRVTFIQPGSHFFLEDRSGAVVVRATPPAPFAVDAAVEVSGTLTLTERGPTIKNAALRSLDDAAVPRLEPRLVSPTALAAGLYARRLVTVEGHVEAVGRFTNRTAFTLRGSDAAFEVCGHSRDGGAMPTDVGPGARIRVTGVADAFLWDASRAGPPYKFWVETQEPRSIDVVERASFWTAERLGLALGAVVLGGLAVGLWAWTLRRRVRARTAELRLERDHAETLRREAQAADRAKSAFLANMSHEIRTPLTAIIGFAQLLEESGGDPDLSGRIERAGLRLLGTINSVLTFARLEAGRTDVRLEPAVLAVLARHAVDSLRPLALTKRLSLALAVDAGAEGARALVDPSHLGRVLDNLIGNAVKFTEKGAVAVRVRADRSRVWVEVSDTGPGIEAGFLPRIFGEFEQATTGERRRFEGSGLGLAITKRLVEAMGGVIEVETVVGRGSSFTVGFARLPEDRIPPSGDGAARDDAPSFPLQKPGTQGV